MGSDTLFIGLAINHPSGGRKPLQTSDQASESTSQAQQEKSAPSCVGFAANVGKCDEFEFVGDFIFQVRPSTFVILRSLTSSTPRYRTMRARSTSAPRCRLSRRCSTWRRVQ